MLITFQTFTELGYTGVEEQGFNRLSVMAEQIVHQHTFNRISADNITEINKFGICELILILNDEETTDTVVSFSNAKYSESYAEKQTAQEKIINIIDTYFTAEQRYRGLPDARRIRHNNYLE